MSDPQTIGAGDPTGEAAAAAQLEADLGLPPGADPTNPASVGDALEDASWEELLTAGLTAWSFLAESRAPAWVFNEREIDALAKAWAPVGRKYAGNVALDVEVAAIIATIPILAPRVLAARTRVAAPVADANGVPLNTGGDEVPIDAVFG